MSACGVCGREGGPRLSAAEDQYAAEIQGDAPEHALRPSVDDALAVAVRRWRVKERPLRRLARLDLGLVVEAPVAPQVLEFSLQSSDIGPHGVGPDIEADAAAHGSPPLPRGSSPAAWRSSTTMPTLSIRLTVIGFPRSKVNQESPARARPCRLPASP